MDQDKKYSVLQNLAYCIRACGGGTANTGNCGTPRHGITSGTRPRKNAGRMKIRNADD